MSIAPDHRDRLAEIKARKAREGAHDALRTAALALTAAIAIDRSRPRVAALVGLRDELARLATQLKQLG